MSANEQPLVCLATANDMADFREIVPSSASESDPLLSPDSPRRSRARKGRYNGRLPFTPGMPEYQLSGDTSYLALETADVARIPTVENPTTLALELCRKKVLQPYLNFLFSVGWVPVFSSPSSWWQKAINIFHPLVVCLLVFLGYIIQYASCFARFNTQHVDSERLQAIKYVRSTDYYDYGNSSTVAGCQQYIISQFLIPDLLHSIAYAYSFYTLRVSQTEQLPTLIERAFLQTSATATGVRSQGRLITKLRFLLFCGVGWVFLSESAQVMHVISQFEDLYFYWLEPRSFFGRVALVVLMLVSFVFLDIVYVAVVINYAVQCLLLIFYIRSITEKVTEKQIDLSRAIKEMDEIGGHMRILNQNPGLAVSIVLVNFATMALLGTLSIITPQKQSLTALMVAASLISVILWAIVIITPIVTAAVLTAKCAWLRKLGHTIRTRPFGFDETPLEEIDSFLLYTSTLTLSAKIFLIPVRAAYVAAVLLIVSSTMLLLFQTGAIHVWL